MLIFIFCEVQENLLLVKLKKEKSTLSLDGGNYRIGIGLNFAKNDHRIDGDTRGNLEFDPGTLGFLGAKKSLPPGFQNCDPKNTISKPPLVDTIFLLISLGY